MQSSGWSGRPERAFLCGQEEDRFTEFLCQLLADKFVLGKFLHLRGTKLSAQELSEAEVSTQHVVADGRIDLVVHTPKHLYVFEAKVSSWLHEKQILSYARFVGQWLSDHPGAKADLVVIAPRAWLRAVLADARAQLKKEFKNAKVSGLSWEEVGELTRSLGESVADLRLKFHLKLFAETVDYRLGVQIRPFTEREMDLLNDPTAGGVIFRAVSIVERTAEILKEEWRLPSKLAITSGSGKTSLYIGYSLKVAGKYFWFGLWADSWMMCGSPFCLQFFAKGSAKASLRSLTMRPPPGNVEYEIVPLPLLPDLEIDQQARRMAGLIQSTVQKLLS